MSDGDLTNEMIQQAIKSTESGYSQPHLRYVVSPKQHSCMKETSEHFNKDMLEVFNIIYCWHFVPEPRKSEYKKIADFYFERMDNYDNTKTP